MIVRGARRVGGGGGGLWNAPLFESMQLQQTPATGDISYCGTLPKRSE